MIQLGHDTIKRTARCGMGGWGGELCWVIVWNWRDRGQTYNEQWRITIYVYRSRDPAAIDEGVAHLRAQFWKTYKASSDE